LSNLIFIISGFIISATGLFQPTLQEAETGEPNQDNQTDRATLWRD